MNDFFHLFVPQDQIFLTWFPDVFFLNFQTFPRIEGDENEKKKFTHGIFREGLEVQQKKAKLSTFETKIINYAQIEIITHQFFDKKLTGDTKKTHVFTRLQRDFSWL